MGTAASQRRAGWPPVLRLPPPWAAFGVLCALLIIAYYVAPLPDMLRNLLYTGIAGMTAVVLIIAAVRRRPDAWLPWALLAAGQVSYAIADTVYDNATYHGQPPYPGLADAFYLLAYPLLAAGLIVLIRRRTPQWQTATIIDAFVVGIAATLLWWVYLLHPLVAKGHGSILGQTVSTAYPAFDLLILVVALRLMLGGGRRPAAYYLLLGSLALMLVADVVYAVENAAGTFKDFTWVDAVWMASYAALGMAALHPSMGRMDSRSAVAVPDATPHRMAVLVAASLAAPVVLMIEYLRGRDADIPVIAVACALMFLLVLGRMAGLLAVQRHEAMTDGLTGLYTRRFFEDNVRVEHDRARRTGFPLSLLLVDADHFKQVNDIYGHPGGDRVLVELADRMRGTLRRGDILARIGGEEFAVLLPATPAEQALELAGRIRRRVAEAPFKVDGGASRRMTVSVGVAVLPDDGRTTADLVRAADEALYVAKRAGRDTVVGSAAVRTHGAHAAEEPDGQMRHPTS